MTRSRLERPARMAAVLALLVIMIPQATAIAADEIVTIGASLSPKNLTVTPGTNVTWQNNDDERHRVRSETGPEEFDSGNLEPGDTFTYNFAIEGVYTYIDDRDEDNTAYHGTITVAADAPPPTDPGDPPPPPPVTGDVNIVNRSFSPSSLTIGAGGTVTWANNDDDEHTVTATDGSWDSGIFGGGATYSRSFANPGTIPYFCIIHPDMTGTITVQGDAGDPPPPPPDPAPPPAPEPPPPPPADGDVNIVDFDFTPATLTVGVGSTVTWANTGAAPHTVTATGGTFDSGFLFTGDTYARTFDAAGSFAYFCTLHPEMTGTVVVQGGGGAPPPPPADPEPPPDPAPPPGPGPSPPPVNGDINIVDFDFTPATLTVGVGSTVTWGNSGAAPHTVTATGGTFDSGFLFTGDTYTRTFTSAGTYSYLCTLHPEMTGTVIVQGGSGDPPPPSETDPPPESPPSPAPVQPVSGGVTILDNSFTPRTKSVTTGTTVVWTNTGAVPHTVTSSAGGFDSGFLLTGDTYRRTFTNPGTFDYVCTIHPGMTGKIIVTGAPTGDPPPEDPVDTAENGGSSVPAGPSNVSIVDNAFRPATLTVSAGQTISWANNGELPHTVTSAAGGFDSGILTPGAGFSVRLTTPGTYDYVCTLHPEMTGTLIVTEAAEPIDESVGAVVVEGGTADAGTAAEETADAGSGREPLVRRTVQMIDNAFQPKDVSVAAGEAVRWRNDGVVPHTATLAGVFDSGFVNPGEDFVHVFDEVGVYEYLCTIHPEMVGTIEVVAAETALAAGVGLGSPSEPLDPAVAFLMAGSIVVAVGVMAFGMARFARAAGDMR